MKLWWDLETYSETPIKDGASRPSDDGFDAVDAKESDDLA